MMGLFTAPPPFLPIYVETIILCPGEKSKKKLSHRAVHCGRAVYPGDLPRFKGNAHDLGALGEIIGAAKACGAENVGGLTFFVEEQGWALQIAKGEGLSGGKLKGA